MPDHPTAPPGVALHRHALCESTDVGEGTRIWAFAHVLPRARLGRDCNICDHVFIENDVVVGDRVTVKSGVQLWDGLRVADDVFIGPNVTFSNDKYPRSKQHQAQVMQTWLERGASIGAGAVVLPGLRIGARAMIGAGSVVTHDVPAKAIVIGNPAQIVGYVDAPRVTGTQPAMPPDQAAGTRLETSVPGVTVHQLQSALDLRGALSSGEFPTHLPFQPKRYFLVYDVPGTEVRGEHAHRACKQFLVCARGHVSVVVDDGTRMQEIRLDRPNLGLYVPPLIWAVQYRYSADALLLVLASDPYDPADYIRDYQEFLSVVQG